MNYKGAFLQFLTKEGVIGRVYDICERPVLGELDNDDPEDYLLALFLFEDTREGARFWCGVQDRWMDYLEDLKNGRQE